MQRSNSMHVNLSVEDLEAVSSSSALGVTAANGRINGTSIPRSASAVTILDILDPRSYPVEKGKRGSRFQSENCVHLIPFVLLLCYFFLWIGSSAMDDSSTILQKYRYLEMTSQEEQCLAQECLWTLDHQVHRFMFILRKKGS